MFISSLFVKYQTGNHLNGHRQNRWMIAYPSVDINSNENKWNTMMCFLPTPVLPSPSETVIACLYHHHMGYVCGAGKGITGLLHSQVYRLTGKIPREVQLRKHILTWTSFRWWESWTVTWGCNRMSFWGFGEGVSLFSMWEEFIAS